METRNVFLAIVLSMAIIFGYQYFFVTTPVPQPQETVPVKAETSSVPGVAATGAVSVEQVAAGLPVGVAPARPALEIAVENGLYAATVSESGGVIKKFRLKNYRENLAADSIGMELIKDGAGRDLPLFFSWGTDPSRVSELPLYEAQPLVRNSDGTIVLTMIGRLSSGLVITRTMTFRADNYLIDLNVEVTNSSASALQGSPYISLVGHPFTPNAKDGQFLFNGPAVFMDGKREEVKVKKLAEDGPQTLAGKISWTAYEDTYFMMAVAPSGTAVANPQSVRLTSEGGASVGNVLSGPAEVINPGTSRPYSYTVFFGPKKMADLKAAGHDFNQSVNFGWFGIVAQPLLVMLLWFHKVVGNYGLAVILVTVMIKLLFWPLTHKGMKSMKGMQKLQPKLAQLREKYKDDKERMAQEQMSLYKTYKINPLGGCLPMLLQIPVFFALYRVLMQAIELRHAPFMLWITDLSAPERLAIGFDIPYLGGLPLLTLLMGGTMFLQQKMTPTPAANPETAKVMMFMPVIFTFMFINFASGLVLYFFVNNLLQMVQQYFINRSED
ncbi:MAG: membrane protein insertase YidC [Desulfobulbaceae bacterium]|nr:membrane protein insertase YidC [Desulfobulbaceae bacterium]